MPSPSSSQILAPQSMPKNNTTRNNRARMRCNKSLYSLIPSSPYRMMALMTLLLVLTADLDIASAFTPSSVIAPLNHYAESTHHVTNSIINRGSRRLDRRQSATALFARNKNGGRKVPKMPTLPVATTTAPPKSPSYPEADDTTASDFYSTSQQSTPEATSTMVVMDVENIRGATSFRISHEALLSRIRLWREDRLSMSASSSSSNSFLEPLIWICDHGLSPSIHHFSSLSESSSSGEDVQMPHNFGAIFAGPGRTADDVIVDLVELRCGGGRALNSIDDDNDVQPASESVADLPAMDASRNSTIVITADARLISRCQQARRKSSSLSDVIFVEPASLLQQLERYRISANEEESLFGVNAAPSSAMTSPMRSGGRKMLEDSGKKRADGKTSTMTSFKDSSIAAQQHAKFQARFGRKKGSSDEIAEKKEEQEAELSSDAEDEEDQSEPDTDYDANSAALAAQLKTEQIRRQLLLSDAYYLARPSKNVRGRRAHTTSAAVHAKYKTRNISKKQQKRLYQKRFGRKRKEDMVNAAVTRKELAGRLQSNLERVMPDSRDDDATGVVGDEGEMLVRSMRLLETLLGKFEQERLMRTSIAVDSSSRVVPHVSSSPTSILGIDGSTAGRIGTDDKWDPLGSTLNVPLRQEEKETTSNEGLPPLRIVVISDTHGFEGALSRFEDPTITATSNDGESSEKDEHHHHIHSDDYLLPRADVLLHCGDFAASGSRKTQRQAARRLDEFLARQTHIPEKIVVQGNHDPDSPAKVLFPSSKALYVRHSSTLVVNGVKFALEPFSRRMAFRSVRRRTSSYALPSVSSFPECDILVSHEPPKGVLDLTYHGFSAGSLYLKELVSHAEHKPRLWLCGHIHESRGVITKHFQSNDQQNDGNVDECKDATTMVINASNANSGRANRLVSGAVVVEVERRPSDTGGGDETAESTLQSRKVDYIDGFLDSVNGDGSSDGAALSGLGEDLELYVTRPGVRRRKGVPQSVRQQMKYVRSTLVTSETSSNED